MKLLAQQTVQQVFGSVTPPPEVANLAGKGGTGGINFILATAVQLIFAFGAIAVIFMLLIGGVQWIISGGEKEKVAEARKRITWAIIGMITLSLAFVTLTIIGKIVGFNIIDPFLPGAGGVGCQATGDCLGS
jgi:NADH:ubiquinone oxidoreductase subunit 6 (subunit J)